MDFVSFLGRHKRVFLLSGIGICILAIVFTINPNIGTNIFSSALTYVVTPVQRGLNASVSWVQGHFSALTNNQRLINENRELHAELNRLQFENFRLALAAEENEALNTALNMHTQYAHLSTMGARVIGQDPNDFQRSFHIDRGANDGLEVSMAVIANGGLAGVTGYVSPTRTQFFSVLDRRFSAHVVAPRTGDLGIATGHSAYMNEGLMRINHIEAAAQIMPGDEILTSSYSVIFPAGILVGEVVSIHTNPDGLTRYALLRPVADVNNLEIVLVVNEVLGDD
ncbi:MAG: rod shape-determining protein MreC [Defluviitaleaceae bacterium]|nr:rod shape-determining protein MreC [Defluviitaleaceae bacterium]